MPDQWGRPTVQDWQRLGLQWINTQKFVNEQNEEKQYKELYQKLANGEDLEKMKNIEDFDPDAVRKAKRSYYQDKMMEWKVQRQEDLKALAKADSLLQDGKLEESAKVLAEQYENFPNGEKAEVEKVVPKGTGKRDATRKLVFKNVNNPEVPDSSYDLTKESLQSVIDSGFATVEPKTYLQTRMTLNEERRQWNAEQAANPTEAVVLDPKTGKQKDTIKTYRVKDSKGQIRTKYVVDGKETWKAPEGKVVSLDTYFKKERLGLAEEGQELAEEKFEQDKKEFQHKKDVDWTKVNVALADARSDYSKGKKDKAIKRAIEAVETATGEGFSMEGKVTMDEAEAESYLKLTSDKQEFNKKVRKWRKLPVEKQKLKYRAIKDLGLEFLANKIFAGNYEEKPNWEDEEKPKGGRGLLDLW